ncbi:alpha-1,2-fucosyltransferase [soil metagenome]
MGLGVRSTTVPLQGGLGNQLFQLAAGLVVGQRWDRPVLWSDYWLRNPEAGETPRAYALDGLLRPDELISARTGRHGWVTDRLLSSRVVERRTDDDALARVGRWTVVLAGYLQRLSYAEEAWPLLRERFASSPHAHHRRLVAAEPAPYGALHYRLGDYVTNAHTNAVHGVTSPDYFASVVREKSSTLGLDDWVLVSDEPAQALQLLRSTDLPSGTRLRPAEGSGEWDDLVTLACARACVISNSSFSWWGAFIGGRSRPTDVVAPRPWNVDLAAAEPTLFPPGWERHDRTVMGR